MTRKISLTALLLCMLGAGVQAQTNIFPATGNVGIGTLTPAEKLTVLTASSVAGITQTNGTVKVGTYVNTSGGYYGTVSNHPLYFRTNNGSAQTTLLTNGNFGIGTITPSERLTVQSAANVLGFAHTNGTVKLGSLLSTTAAFFGTVTNHPLYFRTNNNATAQMSLLQNGNVGIGTATPTARLDVRGSDAYIQMVRVGTGNGNDSSNTCVGRNSLTKNLATIDQNVGAYEGFFNTAVGCNTLRENMYGDENTAIGYGVMEFDSIGIDNTAVGAYALTINRGAANTVMGAWAMNQNTTGSWNTAIGEQALQVNQTSMFNTSVGGRALGSHRRGDKNSAFGYFALYGDTSGADNTGIGNYALQFNFSGNGNTAVGSESMFFNKTGNENTALGYRSLDSNLSGIHNTATGNYALYKNRTGSYNTATGRYALYNTTGTENTGFGDNALFNNTTGGYNTGVGYLATPNTGALSNTSQFGYNARGTASNQVRIGNSSVTSIGGYVNWTNISDGRVKRNIQENVPGLLFINQLKPVTYNLNIDEAEKITAFTTPDKKREGLNMSEENKARLAKQQVLYSGFIAQDVEKAAQAAKYDFSGVDVPKNDKDLYGIRYAEFVVPLVKAVQELSQQNETMKREMEELRAMVKQLSNTTAAKTGSGMNISLTGAALEQNVPNPFSGTTSIGYTLPAGYSKASIAFTDASGKKIREVNLSGAGKGSITLNADMLAAGVYQYSLYVDNRIVASRQIINTK